MPYQHINVPISGHPIDEDSAGKLRVPDHPIICYIEGDGVGVDITPVMLKVVDAAVAKAYDGQRQLHWMEVYNGEKAASIYDGDWFPQETIQAVRAHKVAIKGPLTTSIGGGFRSLNVALRQEMDLYVNMRPVRWYQGLPSPLKHPENTRMTVFRDNSEDIYTGVEWQAGSADAERTIEFLQQSMGVTRINFADNCGIGIKHISEQGSKRLVRQAIDFALANHHQSVTLVHKGNLLRFTEGAFKKWGFELAVQEYAATAHKNERWLEIPRADGEPPLILKDMITDNMLQQTLLTPQEFDVIATTNQNGDILADTLTAQTGGVGIAPVANLNDDVAFFEPSHGTLAAIAGHNKANPSSIILSAEMMLRHIQWHEAAELIQRGISAAFAAQQLTYDLARLIPGAKEISCSDFGEQVIRHMQGS